MRFASTLGFVPKPTQSRQSPAGSSSEMGGSPGVSYKLGFLPVENYQNLKKFLQDRVRQRDLLRLDCTRDFSGNLFWLHMEVPVVFAPIRFLSFSLRGILFHGQQEKTFALIHEMVFPSVAFITMRLTADYGRLMSRIKSNCHPN